jgi:hypothetical protein
MNRRRFLTLVSLATIAAAGTAGVGRALRSPQTALAPWREVGQGYSDPRMRALSYAILAPNPHNRQPWLVDLSAPDRIVLYADRTRLLPHTDPLNRQITIGLGCFLELLRLAAAQEGYRARIVPFPDGANGEQLDDRPVAVVELAKDDTVEGDPLFQHVLSRRSLKEPFDLGKPVASDVLAKLAGSLDADEIRIGSTNDASDVATWRALTRQAMDIEIRTPRTYKESVDLFRIGSHEVDANPDGIDFTGPMFETLGLLGMFTRDSALDPTSSVFQQGYASVMENIDTGMAYVWLVTKTNDRTDQLTAGRQWLRVNLAATAAGLGFQPLSQILQEYPEMSDLYRRCHQTLAPDGGTVQMLARLGYGPQVSPSPRWKLETRLKA